MTWIVLTNGEGKVGVETAANLLKKGADPLDALEAGIKIVESDPKVRTVGFGGAPNMLGEMELDASIMNGATRECGVVGALQGFRHPISVARKVMEKLPHVMLVGSGASRFAEEIGAEKTEMLSSESKKDYEKWLQERLSEEQRRTWPKISLSELSWPATTPDSCKGTTIYLVRNNSGKFAGGVSTSGWFYKYPGRLGDSPVIGAGLYVDDRYGACACTHTGEMSIRAGTARAVVHSMKKGATIEEACYEAREDIRSLRNGHLGALVIHALDRQGNHFVTSEGSDGGVSFWYWSGASDALTKGVISR